MNIKFKIQNSKLKIILSFFIFHFSFFIYDCFSEDRILAIVNNEIITQKDLEDFAGFMRLQTKKEYLKEELLERLIEDRLILQAALKENLKIDRARIERRIEGIKKSYKSIEEFKNTLLNQGLSLADLESKIKEQILMYSIIEKKVKAKISVSPREITDYYLSHSHRFIEPERRKILSLNIKNEEIAKEIKENFSHFKNFEEISLKYSLKIEELDWVNKEQLRPEISEVVFRLKRGEFSPLLSLDGKFYIFKIKDVSEERKMSLKDSQEIIYNWLFEEKFKIALEDWLKELRKNSFIKVNLE